MCVADRLSRREQDLLELLEYVKDNSNGVYLDGYQGNDVSHILQILRDHRDWTIEAEENKRVRSAQNDSTTSRSRHHRRKRRSSSNSERQTEYESNSHDNGRQVPEMGTGSRNTAGVDSRQTDGRTEPGVDTPTEDHTTHNQATGRDTEIIDMQSGNGSESEYSPAGRTNVNSTCYVQCMQQQGQEEEEQVFHVNSHDHLQHVEHEEHDALHEVAHGLHFASIAILGFLVVEVGYFVHHCLVVVSSLFPHLCPRCFIIVSSMFRHCSVIVRDYLYVIISLSFGHRFVIVSSLFRHCS